jgi:hypothetical protein
MNAFAVFAVLALSCQLAAPQPFLPGQGIGPLGNWRTTDAGGPYNLELLSQQANEVAAGAAARGNFTDADRIDFLTNVECLEGQFDTYGAFGTGFRNNLNLGGPTPIGAQKANISAENLPYMEEVALNEQGHALFTRHAGSSLPCPLVDFTGGFNAFFAAAYNLTGTIESVYGRPFNPFQNDATYFTSVLALEELGATGNKGLAGQFANPVLANGVMGLATSATAQATIERFVLWNIRNQTVDPFGETVQQVVARVSALRDELDGPQNTDQGLVNTDPRYIAVPDQGINLIPTDARGLTLNRSPQQVIRILTLASPDSKGVFFPNGLLGNINSWIGYNETTDGFADFPTGVATQESVAAVGTIEPAVNGSTPATVPGEGDLTQSTIGPLTTASYLTRGYNTAPLGQPEFSPAQAPVQVAEPIATAGRR